MSTGIYKWQLLCKILDSIYLSNKRISIGSRKSHPLHDRRRKVGWLTSHETPLLKDYSWSLSAIPTYSLICRLFLSFFLSVSSFPLSYGIHRTISARDQLTLLPTLRSVRLSTNGILTQVCLISRLRRLQVHIHGISSVCMCLCVFPINYHRSWGLYIYILCVYKCIIIYIQII